MEEGNQGRNSGQELEADTRYNGGLLPGIHQGAAVAVLAAAAAAAAAAVFTAGEGARDRTPLSERHHPADSSARAASFPPRSPSPPPSGAIRLHPRPRSPHPQVRGLSPGRGGPDEPGRVTICSATWQELEEGMIFNGVFLR